ncbi:MAG TPA: tetratricopeptide repeat protein [Candidatus Manganitrophaceae bacterium]|nr:tetratricopeptide repeat protein [Candidatus Manganitrophaceae bacterium]
MKSGSRRTREIVLFALLALSFLLRGSAAPLVPLGVSEKEAASGKAAEVNNHGVELFKNGEFFDALIHFVASSQMDPTLWKYHYNCAVVLLAAGNVEEARVHLDRSRKIDPDNPEMRRYHAALLQEINQNTMGGGRPSPPEGEGR